MKYWLHCQYHRFSLITHFRFYQQRLGCTIAERWLKCLLTWEVIIIQFLINIWITEFIKKGEKNNNKKNKKTNDSQPTFILSWSKVLFYNRPLEGSYHTTAERQKKKFQESSKGKIMLYALGNAQLIQPTLSTTKPYKWQQHRG